MNTPFESASANRVVSRSEKTTVKKRRFGFIWIFLAWIILISGGMTGAYYYTEQMKEQIIADLYSQTEHQLHEVQKDYELQMKQLEQTVAENMSQLQSKVDSLTELLVFTKNNATDQTNNSNQLYAQLAEVKRQLEELKKNLDVLK